MRWLFIVLVALGASACDSGVDPNPWGGRACQYGPIIVDYGHGPAWACAPAPEPAADPDAGVDQ